MKINASCRPMEKCGGCNKVLDSKCKPVDCSICSLKYHKTNCCRLHRCILRSVTTRTDNFDSYSENSAAIGISNVSSSNVRFSNDITYSDSALSNQVVAQAECSNSYTRCLSAETHSQPALTTTSAQSSQKQPVHQPLNPNAPSYQLDYPHREVPKKVTRTQPRTHQLSPEKAEIEALKLNLVMPRRKSSSLILKTMINKNHC